MPMRKYGIIAILLIFGSLATVMAVPTGNEPAILGKTETEFIRVYNTGVRTQEGIQYAIYKLDQFQEPVEFIGIVQAQGYGYLTYKIRALGLDNNKNYFWQYSDACQEGRCCHAVIGGIEYNWKILADKD